ncbi:hypothetical protein [Thioalkalivibrio nitratireducens]|nr:hypothetical protein [Thioalkalivibrio nitratireducens]
MTEAEKEACLVSAVLRQLNNHRLPKLFAIRERLNRGGLMDPDDIRYLQASLHDTMQIRYLCEAHPDLSMLCTKVTNLHREITMRALENETQTH